MAVITIVGGSLDPIGLHHIELIKAAAVGSDRTVVLPCGMRPDKLTVNDINPAHRAAMIDLTLRQLDIPGLEIDFSDLEQYSFTPTIELDRRYRAQGHQVRHAIGSDLVSQIRNWTDGEELWQEAYFVIYPRQGYEPQDLPRRYTWLQGAGKSAGSSTEIRRLVYNHEPFDHLVDPRVAEYIRTHRLYTGQVPRQARPMQYEKAPKLLVVPDLMNQSATDAARLLQHRHGARTETDADMILVLGGDGTMLRAIHQHWQLRIPFFGINFGFIGFLMNDIKAKIGSDEFFKDLVMYYCPMLHVTAKFSNGETRSSLAFNDAWVERERGGGAHVEVLVDGQSLGDLYGDGVLITSAAGSTGYWRATGEAPFKVGTPDIGVAPICLSHPSWNGKRVPDTSVIELRNADPGPRPRRPLFAYADGKSGTDFGQVTSLTVRSSGVSGVQLILNREYSLDKKLLKLLMPR